MAVMDIRSNLQPQLAFNAGIVADTTTAGYIIDTADFDPGNVITLFASSYTDGNYEPLLEESDDAAMAGAVPLADDKLIGTEAGAAVSGAAALGDVLPSIGFHSNLRYVRLSIVSTGVTTGASIQAVLHQKAEILPAV